MNFASIALSASSSETKSISLRLGVCAIVPILVLATDLLLRSWTMLV